MKKKLDLSYKGERNYLHGSDIFNVLATLAEEVTGKNDAYIERITFRGFARKACFLETDCPEDRSKVVGEVCYRVPCDAEPCLAFVVEGSEDVAGRYAFDEAAIVRDAVLDMSCRSATIPFQSKYSVIENIIALTKLLNYKIAPDVTGKWVFGQLDLKNNLVENCDYLSVIMIKSINNKFSMSDIFIDGNKIGSIRFIAGAP